MEQQEAIGMAESIWQKELLKCAFVHKGTQAALPWNVPAPIAHNHDILDNFEKSHFKKHQHFLTW